MTELVTGEAVVLGLQPAKLPSRMVAVAIDLVVWWVVYVGVVFALAAATASLDTAAQAAVGVAALLACVVGLPVMVETLSRGRSLGKVIFGLRVVRDDGGPIRFRHALVRGAVGAVEIQASLGVIACIASLVSARGRRIGDVFGGTLVVRERIPGQELRQPPPPPWLAGRFTGVDLSGLPEELWMAVRQYLSRMEQLDPQVSWTMAEKLAGDVAARIGTGAPQGVPPAAFLSAVVAERQARDAQRVFGQGGYPGGGYPSGGYPGGGYAGGGAVAGGEWGGGPGGDGAYGGAVPGGLVAGSGYVAGQGGPPENRGWAPAGAAGWDGAAGSGRAAAGGAADGGAVSGGAVGEGAGGGVSAGEGSGAGTGFAPPA